MRTRIANKLFSADDLDTETHKWAHALASGAPLSMAAAKRLLRQVGRMSFGEAITAEGLEQNPLTQSDDFKAGVKAFFDKEKPVFKGR